jgi:hypothetical protein
MADAGLFIGFGEPVRGREGPAVDSFNDTVAYLGQIQSEGRIEDFEIVFLDPHGGDLGGFMLVRGSADQMHAVRQDEQFLRQMTQASLVVERLGVVNASLGDGIARQMAIYQEQIGAFA